MIEVLRDEGNREELEWLVRLFTVCEPYPVEGVIPMDRAYPFRQRDFGRYVSFLIDPEFEMYEYDEEFYLGPDACYGFRDEDFICLDGRTGDNRLDCHLTATWTVEYYVPASSKCLVVTDKQVIMDGHLV